MKSQDLSKLVTVMIAAGATFAAAAAKEESWILAAAVAASAISAALSVLLSRRHELYLKKKRIFFIYNHNDRVAALELASKLRERGYNPWIDVEEISPGQRWLRSIERGIEKCAVALLLVSKHVDSERSFVAHELQIALKSMRSRDESFSPVIPIRLDDTEVPQALSDVHWVDIRDENAIDKIDTGLKRLLSAA